MIINSPMFDYVRMTTFEENRIDYIQLAVDSDFGTCDDETTAKKIMQYAGFQRAGVFIGAALQKGKPHWMIDGPGEVSERLIDILRPSDHIVRIDVQVTVPLKYNYDSAKFAATMEKNTQGRNVRLIRNTNRMDTVYVGSRQSGKLIRFYVKQDDDGAKYLRYEIEIKGDHVRAFWKLYKKFAIDPKSMLASELQRLPRSQTTQTFEGVLGIGGSSPKVPARVKDVNRTLDWFQLSVMPSLERLIRDHDHGHLVRQWVTASLVEYAKEQGED